MSIEQDNLGELVVQPITFREACAFVRELHSHHKPPVGCKFCVAVSSRGEVVGVAIVGRPIARMLDDGWTAEVTRCCTDGTKHVASKLYAACRRAAFGMGYRRLITYTLGSERGTSVRAAGWTEIGRAGGGGWSRAARPRVDDHPTGHKTLWEAPSGD